MKIYFSLLALCAAPTAAFMGPAAKSAMQPVFSVNPNRDNTVQAAPAYPAGTTEDRNVRRSQDMLLFILFPSSSLSQKTHLLQFQIIT